MDVERIGAVALLRMRAGRANAIGPAFLDGLDALLDGLLATPPGALVLTGEGRAFSSGLDLPALLDLPPAALVDFIQRFSATMLRVFTLPFPVVAAVNGHAVAGGCVLALQADQRLMAEGEGRIGLNEVRLGIGLPAAMVETLRCQVPAPALFPVVAEGGLFSPEEALGLGLVHALHPPEKLLERAVERATALAAVPALAFAQLKASLRRPALAAISAAGPTDAAGWVSTFVTAEAQRLLRDVVARLAKRG